MKDVEGSRCDIVQCKIYLEILRNNANIFQDRLSSGRDLNTESSYTKEGMYVCIRVGHKAGPCTATFNDLLCFPFQLALY
jgi:hypothetical protein